MFCISWQSVKHKLFSTVVLFLFFFDSFDCFDCFDWMFCLIFILYVYCNTHSSLHLIVCINMMLHKRHSTTIVLFYFLFLGCLFICFIFSLSSFLYKNKNTSSHNMFHFSSDECDEYLTTYNSSLIESFFEQMVLYLFIYLFIFLFLFFECLFNYLFVSFFIKC